MDFTIDVISKSTRLLGVVGCAVISITARSFSITTRSIIVCRLTAREVVKG